MKKNNSRLIRSILIICILTVMISTTTFAAWWGTPGYEWARSKGLTYMMSNSALNRDVSLSDFYYILLKYLDFKDVTPKSGVVQHVNDTKCFNQALVDMIININSYLEKTSLTPQEYRNVATYIEHVDKIVQEQKAFLTRDDLKSFDLYLSLCKYKAATMIDEASYKTYVLSKMGEVKYKEIVKYNIKPYYGNVSRKEFLVLMFSLLSEQGISEDEMLKQYNESGVLLGYDDDLMLSKNLTYAEMFTFLKRFENFEFNPVTEEDTETEENDDRIVEVK